MSVKANHLVIQRHLGTLQPVLLASSTKYVPLTLWSSSPNRLQLWLYLLNVLEQLYQIVDPGMSIVSSIHSPLSVSQALQGLKVSEETQRPDFWTVSHIGCAVL
jgi:hypothetical protein